MESFQPGDSPEVLISNSTPPPSTSTSTSRWSPNSADWNEASNLAAAALAAPARVWSSLVHRLPPLTCSRLLAARLPQLTDSRLLAAVSDIHRRLLTGHRRRPGLPLPIHQDVSHSIRVAGERPKAYAILEDIVQYTLSNLHSIQKSLLYWQYRAEGTDSQKMYFMIFERGPRAFVEATCETLTRLRNNRSPSQYLLKSASDMISTKLAVLTGMQHCLAAFLAEVYLEADKFRDGLTESSDKSLHTLFIILNIVFPKLEVSLTNASEGKTVLLFERLREIDAGSSQWTEVLSVDAISSIYQNLQKLDSFVSSQLSNHEKTRHMTIYWLPYTCGAIGLSACSLWLLRQSSLMGSSDMDNWIQDAKESGAGFWNHRVEKPIIYIRDELLKTFRRTGRHVTQKQDVQLTEESLHRMLLAFCEQTSDEKLPQDASDQVLMEIVTKRYVKESAHPIQNLFAGNLARAMLIQIEKHRLDLQELMLGMYQIMKANEINFAILAALPAFGLSLLLLLVVQTWVTHDQRAEGRGRIARRQRRLLLEDVQRRLREFQTCMDNGMEEEARCKFGLTLYTLDRLYRAVELHAKETGEWSRLRENLFDLAKPSMEVAAKLAVISESVRNYDCLLPSPTSS